MKKGENYPTEEKDQMLRLISVKYFRFKSVDFVSLWLAEEFHCVLPSLLFQVNDSRRYKDVALRL